MTHIDFVIGFILIMSAIFMVMYFVTNSISNNVSEVVANDMKESSLVLEKYFFRFQNDNSLVDTANDIGMVVTEKDSLAHSEDVSVSIMPGSDTVRMYDGFWNQTSTSVIQIPGQTTLSVNMDFHPNEEKRFNIVYFGEAASEVVYSSSGNATAVILAGKELQVVSQERCSILLAREYDEVKESLDFGHNFRIELPGCTYGLANPAKANIMVRNVPVLYEGSDGYITPIFARLLVW